MSLDIAAIKARAEKATAGPWEFSPETFCGYGFSVLWNPETRAEIITTGGKNDGDSPVTWMGEELRQEDREFIEDARTDIPDLLAALEASEAARVKAEQERDARDGLASQAINDLAMARNRITAIEADRDALKEALKPFARIADREGDKMDDTESVFVAMGRLRAARRALEASK